MKWHIYLVFPFKIILKHTYCICSLRSVASLALIGKNTVGKTNIKNSFIFLSYWDELILAFRLTVSETTFHIYARSRILKRSALWIKAYTPLISKGWRLHSIWFQLHYQEVPPCLILFYVCTPSEVWLPLVCSTHLYLQQLIWNHIFFHS